MSQALIWHVCSYAPDDAAEAQYSLTHQGREVAVLSVELSGQIDAALKPASLVTHWEVVQGKQSAWLALVDWDGVVLAYFFPVTDDDWTQLAGIELPGFIDGPVAFDLFPIPGPPLSGNPFRQAV